MRSGWRTTSGVEPFSRVDASNLVIDTPDQVNVFLMAGVLGPGGVVRPGSDPDVDALRRALAARLDGAEHGPLRRLVQRPQGSRRRPVWAPSPPDLTQHVRLTDPVAGPRGFEALCARLMTAPMSRDRPMWELLVVPGAAAEGPGLVLRVHHAIADGAAAVVLVRDLFADVAGAATEMHDGDASGRSHDRDARSTRPGTGGRRVPTPSQVATGVRRVSSMVRATLPPTVLLGPLGRTRAVSFTDVDLEPLRRGARAVGATVNDALLAAVSVAVEAALLDAGEPVPRTLPASVPLALPDRGGSGNAVGVMMVPLPTGEPDLGRRLAIVAGHTRRTRTLARSQGTLELMRTPWGAWVMARLARRQRFIALFVTNVRGPVERLRVAGAPLLRAWPLAQIQGDVRLGVAAMSYAGRLGVTVHVDGPVLRADLLGEVVRRELCRLSGVDDPAGDGL